MEENCGEYNGVKHSVRKDHDFARLMAGKENIDNSLRHCQNPKGGL